MGRSILAGFAGFSAACAILFGLLLFRGSGLLPLHQSGEDSSDAPLTYPVAMMDSLRRAHQSEDQLAHAGKEVDSVFRHASYATVASNPLLQADVVTDIKIAGLAIENGRAAHVVVQTMSSGPAPTVSISFKVAGGSDVKISSKINGSTVSQGADLKGDHTNHPLILGAGNHEITFTDIATPATPVTFTLNVVPAEAAIAELFEVAAPATLNPGSTGPLPNYSIQADAATTFVLKRKADQTEPLAFADSTGTTALQLSLYDPKAANTAAATHSIPASGSFAFKIPSTGEYKIQAGGTTPTVDVLSLDATLANPNLINHPKVTKLTQRVADAIPGPGNSSISVDLEVDLLKITPPTGWMLFGNEFTASVVHQAGRSVVNPSPLTGQASIVPMIAGNSTTDLRILADRSAVTAGDPLILKITDSWASARFADVAVRPFAPTIARPTIATFIVPRGAISGATSPIKIAGSQLTVSGGIQNAERLELWILADVQGVGGAGTTVHLNGAPIPVTLEAGSSRWTQSVDLSSIAYGTPIYLMAVAYQGSGHQGSELLSITTSANEVGLTAFEVKQVSARDPLVADAAADNAFAAVGASGTIAATEVKIELERFIGVVAGDIIKVESNGQALATHTVKAAVASDGTLNIPVTGLQPLDNRLVISLNRSGIRGPTRNLDLRVVNSGPQVVDVQPDPFGTVAGQATLNVVFTPGRALDPKSVQDRGNYVLVRNAGRGDGIVPNSVSYNPTTNTASLHFADATTGVSTVVADNYLLFVNGKATSVHPRFTSSTPAPTATSSGIRDAYGNLLDGEKNGGRGTDYSQLLDGSSVKSSPSEAATTASLTIPPKLVGLPEPTGPPVDYPEFVEPRKRTSGFNPSDKVISRVARLYYFRDAHRAVQIINRRAKSYNAQNATMSGQLADKARVFAQNTVDRRQAAERGAVQSAAATRQMENTINRYQQQLQQSERELQRLQDREASENSEVQRLEAALASANQTSPTTVTPEQLRTAQAQLSQTHRDLTRTEANVELVRQQASAALAALDGLRERELQLRETMNVEQAKEDRAIEQQFRLEVRAAKDDPDTYAQGDPESFDPVGQVTLSVIGEGLIQMRGPTKGVNIVHTMINQLDSPVGQVRVGVHTVQVNGERASRMEDVVGRIQRYVDHSRFLTSQSSQMLRNAVAQVASHKAQQCGLICRDDMIIGSKDSKPAKNDAVILKTAGVVSIPELSGDYGMMGTPEHRYQDAFFGREFMQQLRASDSEFAKSGNKVLSLHSMDTTSLASALFMMALASNDTRMEILAVFQQMTQCKLPVDEFEFFEASDVKQGFGCRKFEMMADNARFVSLRGYFDAQISGNDTLNPAQREFIKLSQILKSRLITERELKQRVVERALIEERIGDFDQQATVAALNEVRAKQHLNQTVTRLRSQAQNLLLTLSDVEDEFNEQLRDARILVEEEVEQLLSAKAEGSQDNLREIFGFALSGLNSYINSDVAQPTPRTKNSPSDNGKREAENKQFLNNLEDKEWFKRARDGTLKLVDGFSKKDAERKNASFTVRGDASLDRVRKSALVFLDREFEDVKIFAEALIASAESIDDLKKIIQIVEQGYFADIIDRAVHQAATAVSKGDRHQFDTIINNALYDVVDRVLRETKNPQLIKLAEKLRAGSRAPLPGLYMIQLDSKTEVLIQHLPGEADEGFALGFVNRHSVEAALGWIDGEMRQLKVSPLWSELTDSDQSRFTSRLLRVRSEFADSRDLYRVFFGIRDVILDIATRQKQNVESEFASVKQGLEKVLAEFRSAIKSMLDGEIEQGADLIARSFVFWREWSSLAAATMVDRNSNNVEATSVIKRVNADFASLVSSSLEAQFADAAAREARRPLDHKKFLDMLIDEAEEKHIELVEGTRAHTAVIDDYVKRLATALEDDFNAQFYDPAFRNIREETHSCWDVNLGQIEHTTVLTNNRQLAKVSPQATMEFDLPRRRIMIAEAMQSAQAAYNDYGALLNDPTFLALTKLNSGQPSAAVYGQSSEGSAVRSVLPGLPSQSGESAVIQAQTGQPQFASQLEALIPDPAVYKFETGTGYEIRPVIQPDGQSVVFDFNYMYTTNIREPVRADEKHLGRVKRHYIDTDVQIGNYELREVSRYRVALKASRTSRGVPLLEDIPVAGALFRPLPSSESSLQQNLILAQTVIYPTMFDLMGLRWAPAVADLDTEDLKLQEFTYKQRLEMLKNEVYDYSSTQVDEFLRIPEGERRADLYRPQREIPVQHPNGYIGPGNDRQDSYLQEGYSPDSTMAPGHSGTIIIPRQDNGAVLQPIPPQSSYQPSPTRPSGNRLRDFRQKMSTTVVGKPLLRSVPVTATEGTFCPPNQNSGGVRQVGHWQGMSKPEDAGVVRLTDQYEKRSSSRQSPGDGSIRSRLSGLLSGSGK